MQYIKQYGLPRTCTNYSKLLIEENFNNTIVLASVLGWKHGPHPEVVDWSGESWHEGCGYIECDCGCRNVPDLSSSQLEDIKAAYLKNEIKYIICVKHPVAWYLSYAKDQEIWGPGKKIQQDHLEKSLNLWSVRHEQWNNTLINNPKMHVYVFVYEDFLLDTNECLDEMTNYLQLDYRKDQLYIPKDQKIIKGDQSLVKDNAYTNQAFDMKYYLDGEYYKYYSKKELKCFEKLDWNTPFTQHYKLRKSEI